MRSGNQLRTAALAMAVALTCGTTRYVGATALPAGDVVLAVSGDNAGVNGGGSVDSLIDESNSDQRFGSAGAGGSATVSSVVFPNGSSHQVLNFIPAAGINLNTANTFLSYQNLNIFVVADTNANQTSGEFVTNYDNNGNSNGYAVGNSDSTAGTIKVFSGYDSAGDQFNDTTNLGLTAGTYYGINANINQAAGKFASTTSNGLTYTTASEATYGNSGDNTIPYDGSEVPAIGYLADTFAGAFPNGFQQLDGNIAEVLVYDDDGLSAGQIAAETAAVNTYIANKYFVTPEPASIGLLAFGGLGLLARRRRQA